jgi:hypothetical protein
VRLEPVGEKPLPDAARRSAEPHCRHRREERVLMVVDAGETQPRRVYEVGAAKE